MIIFFLLNDFSLKDTAHLLVDLKVALLIEHADYRFIKYWENDINKKKRI